MKNDSLGDRMKAYENISRIYLTRRMPLIIRIDGKAFHSFTRGFDRPFDHVFIKAMQDTAAYLCKNIMGCKIAYVQSDEISLLLTDYDTLTTDPWFGKNLQKTVSVSASMATMAFNLMFEGEVQVAKSQVDGDHLYLIEEIDEKYSKVGTAMFDARAFILPKEEVCNYFIWRQQDCVRNSIQSVGQAHFSNKELYEKTCKDIQDMLMLQKNINWDDFTSVEKRGTCITKTNVQQLDDGTTRTHWECDLNIPTFTQNRDYIEHLI